MGNFQQDHHIDEILRIGKRQNEINNEARRALDRVSKDASAREMEEAEKRFDALMAEWDELEERKCEAKVAVRELEGLDNSRVPGSGTNASTAPPGGLQGLDIADYQRSQPVWYDVDKKKEVRVVSGDDDRTPFFIRSSEDADFSQVTLGGIVRALAAGPRNDAEKRALAEGTDSAGGYTVPTPLAGGFVDLLRPKSHVMRSGAQLVELTSETLKIAKQTGDPAFGWRAEGGAVNESDPIFDQLLFTAKSCACTFKASLELLQDSVNVDRILQNALTQAAAQEIDRIALLGSGSSNEPEGIINVTGINQVSMGTNGAAITGYSQILAALQALEDDDAEAPTAMLMAPRTKYDIAGLTATDNQPLNAPPVVASIPMRSSSKIPVDDTQGTATDASRIILGNFRELLIGMRSQLRVEVLRERYMDTLQVGFIAHMRLDVQLAHPESFCEIVGITP